MVNKTIFLKKIMSPVLNKKSLNRFGKKKSLPKNDQIYKRYVCILKLCSKPLKKMIYCFIIIEYAYPYYLVRVANNTPWSEVRHLLLFN